MALGPVKPHVKAAADAIIAQFGIKTVYGWRPADPFPDHPSGLAVDFMINDIPNGKAVGDALADYVIKNGVALNVKYLIWYRRSYNIQRGSWQPYNQPGQPPHTDHVHVTWNPDNGSGGVVTTPVSNPLDSIKDQVQSIYQAFQTLSKIADWVQKPGNLARYEIGAWGVALIIFGLLKFDKVAAVTGRAIGTVTGKVAGVVKNGK